MMLLVRWQTVSQPGYYDHQTISVTLPGNLAPGTYYIGGIADYGNQVSESNEGNNTYNVVQVTATAPVATAPQAATTASASTNGLFGGGTRGDAFVFAALGKDTITNNPPVQDHRFDQLAVAPDMCPCNALTVANSGDVLIALAEAGGALQHHLSDFLVV